MLFSSSRSYPVKAAVAAVINPPASIEKEMIWMRGAMAGRLKMSIAR